MSTFRRHRHSWRFIAAPIGGTGWSIFECATCGKRDIG